MNVEQVQYRVEQIRAMADDDETAHATQDELYRDVLAAIMRGECEGDVKDIARAALAVEEIEFSRWYA